MPTQNLYPNAAGDLTQFATVEPSSINHFQAVDETSADDDTSYIQSGVDESVTFFITIKENSTTTHSSTNVPSDSSYANYTKQYTAKPSDSSAFTVTDINNLQIGVQFTGNEEPTDQTDLFNIEDWPHNSGDTINSVTITARWKNAVGGAFAQRLRLTQIFATVDYTAAPGPTTGPLKIQAGAKVKITSGKLKIGELE